MKKLFILLVCLPTILISQDCRIKSDTTYLFNGVSLRWVSNMPNDTVVRVRKLSDSKVNVQFPPNGLVQDHVKKWNYKRTLLGCGVAFVGGVANGYHETILHHYPQFKKVHPNANDQYWNPEISWLNKYEDFDRYGKKEAYFGSTTFLAWTTDAYHLTSVISNTSLIGATCIITIGEKRKWWEYGIDILAMSLSRSAGFHLIYSQIYK